MSTSTEQSLRDRVVTAVAAERARLDEMRTDASRMRYPRWQTESAFGDESRLKVTGPGFVIYDEGGHDQDDADHIAAWDPRRVSDVVTLAEALLQEHRPYEYQGAPGTCRGWGCRQPMPCPVILMLADIWLPQDDPDHAEPLALLAGLSSARLTELDAVIFLAGSDPAVRQLTLSPAREGVLHGAATGLPPAAAVTSIEIRDHDDPDRLLFSTDFVQPGRVRDDGSLTIEFSLS